MHNLEPFDQTKAITLTEACKLIRSRVGKPLNRQIAQRYAGRGIRIAGFRRLFLPSVRMSGVYWTMPSWVQWFQEQRGTKPRTIEPELDRTPKQRQRSHERAMEFLRKRGMVK